VAKEAVKKIKLQIPAGKATPAPPVGTVLGPAGINLQDFCTKYNEATRDKMGDILPVEISIYDDRSFDFVVKTPPAAFLIKKYAKIEKGSVKGANQIVATLTQDQIKEIATTKLPDLNAYDVEAAMKIVEGTARNMGVAVKGVNDAELAEQAAEAQEAEKEAQENEAKLAEMEAELTASKEVPTVDETEEAKEASETTEDTEAKDDDKKSE
jgi:large subunit ribosomal protein L11